MYGNVLLERVAKSAFHYKDRSLFFIFNGVSIHSLVGMRTSILAIVPWNIKNQSSYSEICGVKSANLLNSRGECTTVVTP